MRQTTIAVLVGWMNFCYKERKYKAVKGAKSHPESGPRKIKFELDAGYEHTLGKLTSVFFPGGRSHLGKLNQFDCTIGEYNGTTVEKTTFSLGSFIRVCSTKVARIYLQTKEKVM